MREGERKREKDKRRKLIENVLELKRKRESETVCARVFSAYVYLTVKERKRERNEERTGKRETGVSEAVEDRQTLL